MAARVRNIEMPDGRIKVITDPSERFILALTVLTFLVAAVVFAAFGF